MFRLVSELCLRLQLSVRISQIELQDIASLGCVWCAWFGLPILGYAWCAWFGLPILDVYGVLGFVCPSWMCMVCLI